MCFRARGLNSVIWKVKIREIWLVSGRAGSGFVGYKLVFLYFSSHVTLGRCVLPPKLGLVLRRVRVWQPCGSWHPFVRPWISCVLEQWELHRTRL